MKQFSTSCIAMVALLGFASASAADMPYAGQQSRPIKALSDQEVADYVEGRGMGSSKAAELNHYPGPAHVIADSSRLGLTDKQKTETQSVFDAMSIAAKSSGAAIVAKEAELDALYASGQAAPAPSRNCSASSRVCKPSSATPISARISRCARSLRRNKFRGMTRCAAIRPRRRAHRLRRRLRPVISICDIDTLVAFDRRLRLRGTQTLTRFRRRALVTTETELSAMAAPAKIGDSSKPKAG